MDNSKEFRCISLCSGYAGIELGLRRAIPNLRTVVYVEVEAFACANLVSKIEEGKLDAVPIWTDIKTFDGKPFRDRVHIITGGYPCQPFSVAGQRKGESDPRHLWPYIERIIETVRPVWCFFENVSGHLTIGFPSVYRSLRNLGYSVEAGLFTAAECGAPHRRERLFILAYNSEQRLQRCLCKSKDISKSSCETQEKGCKQADRFIKCSSDKLADTTAQRIQRTITEGTTQTGRQINEQSITRWPARPGQEQYEWEEPRTVANDNIRQGNAGLESEPREKKIAKLGADSKQKSKGQAQSSVGRTTDGASGRVDRLRLLGNGVVPQCAELAFRTLVEKF